ncbi:hypothetical protein [Legionella brunensis]|uniref:Uncharacterized protein n=1 Tax=Legionella brunensis TaxID=29422 RepID=A0A0W0S160_9GAMM|nr:hypothetical protein [Legionella brunensis]KTC76897.1 hypothetical protein Lbru_3004 [Legionella brunensis]
MPDNTTSKAALLVEIKSKIKALPPNELSYYLTFLSVSVEKESNSKQHLLLLEKTKALVEAMDDFYRNPEKAKDNIIKVTSSAHDLMNASAMCGISYSIKQALFHILGSITAIFTGMACGLSGFAFGLLSNYNLVGNLRGATLGFLSGLAIGILIGYRAPKKLLQNSIESKLEFCIESIKRLGDEFADRKTHEEYEKDTKEYILNMYFKDTPENEREKRFNDFLNSKDQKFQICTTTAGHISKRLKGHLGHHAFIRYSINGVTHIPIEFGERKKTPSFVDQYESPRTVSGKKLFDMLVLDRILQETHERNIGVLATYEIGSNDCRTYIDKILIGTGQEPTKISRFNQNIDSHIARKLVGPLIGFFSRTRGDELYSLIDNPNDEKFVVHEQRWTSK